MGLSLLAAVGDEPVVHANGYICRESFAVSDRPQNFYMIGSMGLASTRMLDALAGCGVTETVIVVGHCQDQVRAAAGTSRAAMRISYVENPEYQKGSILSLWRARDTLLEDSMLVMDADVLFPAVFLERLIASPVRRDAGGRPTHPPGTRYLLLTRYPGTPPPPSGKKP